jgi:hypothetical protein
MLLTIPRKEAASLWKVARVRFSKKEITQELGKSVRRSGMQGRRSLPGRLRLCGGLNAGLRSCSLSGHSNDSQRVFVASELTV